MKAFLAARSRAPCALLLAALCTISFATRALDRHVDATNGADTGDCSVAASPCRTITYAMGQALAGGPGDLIHVAPGTYNAALGEVFPIAMKSGVRLKASGRAADTVVDATGANARVFVANATGATTLIEGFTITGGLHLPAPGAIAQGGAILLENFSQMSLLRNVFVANEARGFAGVPASPAGGSARGGAVATVGGSFAIVHSNLFRANKAQGGAGLGRSDGSPGGAGGSASGGAMWLDPGMPAVANNTFHGNQAVGGAGGDGSTAAGGSGGQATNGALDAPLASIVNNIFAANAAVSGAGGAGSPAGATPASLNGAMDGNGASTTSNNVFFANTATGGTVTVGVNALTSDPQFVSAPANLRIAKTSPANGAGTATEGAASDFDGRARTTVPSIGAFEPGPVVYDLVLDGAQEVPPVATAASGRGTARFNPGTRELALLLPYSGLSSPENGAHIHGPAPRGVDAGILYPLGAANPKTDVVTLTNDHVAHLVAGTLYINVHTNINPGGEIRAQIDTFAAPVAPAALDFGGQSMGTTAAARRMMVTNTEYGPLAVTGVASSNTQFAVAGNACATLPAGGTCFIDVTFSPAVMAGALNSTAAVNGSLTITTDAPGGPHVVPLAGTAEKSLVTHYYGSILRRAPDPGGKSFWQGEAARLATLGVNVNETWFAMSASFYFSTEYVALGRDPTEYVTDLYNTFFNRAPDGAGLSFWTGQMGSGMPPEVVLVSFMFSAEFVNFTQAIFGNTAVRAEIDTVTDFYRGLLSRVPDDGGFNFWVQQFRNAQCAGAAAVVQQAEAISASFANSPEYGARNRTNAQFVGDLYNAFLRRGGDLEGVQFWIGRLDSGALTRNQVRQQFVASPEFSNRVNNIIAQGCLTP